MPAGLRRSGRRNKDVAAAVLLQTKLAQAPGVFQENLC
jgi:hypothetical protein